MKQLKKNPKILDPDTWQKDITGLCYHPTENTVPNKMLPTTRQLWWKLISWALTTAKQLVSSVIVIKENNTCKMASPGLKPGNFSVISTTCCLSLSLTCLKRGEKKENKYKVEVNHRAEFWYSDGIVLIQSRVVKITDGQTGKHVLMSRVHSSQQYPNKNDVHKSLRHSGTRSIQIYLNEFIFLKSTLCFFMVS